mmetsp:Transcript_150375/g.481249  ORF Transcript_150375/g.481249 Transcript_150375/m.481249 type:complete len:532 (+) Transcript_150375:358-1953(+)
MADRLSTRYPIVYGQPLPVPKLRAGLAVSWGALSALAENVANACAAREVEMLREYMGAHSVFQGTEEDTFDFAASLCLFHAKAPHAEPLGHEEEHFVLGASAAERVMVRRAIGRAGHFRYGARPCVLSAHPVSLHEQRLLAGMARGHCSAALAEHISVSSIQYGSEPTDGEEMEFKELDGYGVSDVSMRIIACGVQIPPHVEAPILPAPPLWDNRTMLSVLVGLPGGGTSWFFEALEAGHGRGLAKHDGFFHPYCHQLWRVELSHFVAATEDLSRIHLFRERVPPVLFDDLVQRMVRQFLRSPSARTERHRRPSALLTRENLNVWRVPDYVRNGFRPVTLYRHRKHTFPLSDAPGSPSWDDLVANMHGSNDAKYSTLCRTCFYFLMYYSPQMGSLGSTILDRPIMLLSRMAAHAPDTPLVKQVAAHTLFWYVILRLARLNEYSMAFVSYESLIRSSPDELKSDLRQTLPFGIDGVSVADFVLSSRQDASWLDKREERYAETPGFAEAEHFAQGMIRAMREADANTNVDMLV